jgi:hypothetical protein
VEDALNQHESLHDVAMRAAWSQRQAPSRIEHVVEDHGVATIPFAIQTLTVFAPDLSRDLQGLVEVRQRYLTESLSALQHVGEIHEGRLSEYGIR